MQTHGHTHTVVVIVIIVLCVRFGYKTGNQLIMKSYYFCNWLFTAVAAAAALGWLAVVNF